VSDDGAVRVAYCKLTHSFLRNQVLLQSQSELLLDIRSESLILYAARDRIAHSAGV